MRVPSNMSEEEVVSTINKVASRLAHKFTFAFYELEDIKQEAFIIAMEAMNRYDEKKPLENFLFVHVANRLKNFKRDNYFRQDEGSAQKIQKRKVNFLRVFLVGQVFHNVSLLRMQTSQSLGCPK